MKNSILKNGIVGGVLTSLMMGFVTFYMKTNPEAEPNMIFVILTMIFANLFIILGIINYQKKHTENYSILKSILVGSLISLIISTIYVGVWLIIYYNFFSDFMEHYAEIVLKRTNPSELSKVTAEMNQMKEWYKSPIMIILLTYMEILPIGILVSLSTSITLFFIQKKKNIVEN